MSTPAIDLSTLPLNRILVREKTALRFLQGPVFHHGGNDVSLDRCTTNSEPFAAENTPSLRIAPLFSAPGDLLCLVPERGNLSLHRGSTGELLRELPVTDVQMVEFSPSGRFLVTFSMPYRGTSTSQPEGNLRLWDTHTGERLAAFVQKAFKAGVIQFSAQETLCFRQGSGEIFVYHAARRAFSSADVLQRIEHKGFTQFKIATLHERTDEGELCDVAVSVAVFNPEAGGKPGRVSLYLCTAASSTQVDIQGPVRERSIFGANDATLLWNKFGTALLVHSQSDVDSSNASYYGATGLYLMHLQGDLSLKVEQSKEGPVHDVQWSPLGDKFIVSAGAMPSHSTLYDFSGTPVYQFGAAHRNTICFSPHGRFVVLAGFGNLAGEMDFYDIIRLKKLGSNTAHCTTASQWSPCSRYFLTASLAPRMNVDNHMKVFKYNGYGPVLKEDFERAYDCIWQPVPAGVFPDRPPSPLRNRDAVNNNTQAQTQAQSTVAAPAAVPAPYRPPRSSGSLSNFMREAREKETAVAVGKVKPSGTPTASASSVGKFVPSRQQRAIPGMAPPGAGPGANKSKAQTQTQSNPVPAKKSTPSAAPAPPAPKATATPAVVPPPAPTPAEDTAESREKKAKALQKKLKQVSELKAKQASGQTLDADQLKKVAGEAALLEELAALNIKA